MSSLQLVSGIFNAGQAALLTGLMAGRGENLSAATVLHRGFEDSSHKYDRVPISSLLPAIPWVSSLNNFVTYLGRDSWSRRDILNKRTNPVRPAASAVANGIAVGIVASLSGLLEIRTLVSLALLCGVLQFVEHLTELAVAQGRTLEARRLLVALGGLYLILWVQIVTSFATVATTTPSKIPASIVAAVSGLFVLYSANLYLASAYVFGKVASFAKVEAAHTLLDLFCRTVVVWSVYLGPVRSGDRLEETPHRDAVQRRATATDVEARVNFYLGERFCRASGPLDLDDPACAAKQNGPSKMYQGTLGMSKRHNYEGPLLRLLERRGYAERRFILASIDVEAELPLVHLVKNRAAGSSQGVLLRCLDFKRHWKNVYRPFPRSIPSWAKKTSKVFWRGTTTGQPTRPGSRFCLVETWFKRFPQIDVGFASTCQGKRARYGKYVVGPCKLADFLDHKYVVSAEGNDKDSGINWKLASDSLILMAKPRVTSWLMETTLVPGKHYVLLKDDFSDLLEKWKWCESHQEECLEIVRNANQYMTQFQDSRVEERIEELVLDRYFAKVR